MPTSMIQCTRGGHGESLVDIDFSQGMIRLQIVLGKANKISGLTNGHNTPKKLLIQ